MAGENELQSQDDGVDHRDLAPTEDRAEPIAETRERAPDTTREGREPAAEAKPASPQEDKRNSIVAKLRAQRDQSDKDPSIDIPADMERRAVGPHVATREDRNRPPAEAVVQEQLKPANVEQPRRIRLKVNGEEREYDEDQVIGYAQVAVASEDILNRAKRERDAAQDERQQVINELAELRRMRADHSRTPEGQPTPAQVKAEDTKPATDEELDSLIEAIQTGEIEDAKKALQQYGDQIERRIQSKIGDIDQRIAATTRQMQEDARVQHETQQVIDTFRTENDDLASSDMRMKVLIDETVEVMRENLHAIGVKDETIANIARTFNVAPQVAVGMAVRKLRENGHELPDNAAVMRTAAKRVREGFGLPDPAVRTNPPPVVNPTSSIVADRVERKQAMPSQPRRANVSPGSEAVTEKSQEQRRIDAVRQMRASRRGR